LNICNGADGITDADDSGIMGTSSHGINSTDANGDSCLHSSTPGKSMQMHHHFNNSEIVPPNNNIGLDAETSVSKHDDIDNIVHDAKHAKSDIQIETVHCDSVGVDTPSEWVTGITYCQPINPTEISVQTNMLAFVDNKESQTQLTHSACMQTHRFTKMCTRSIQTPPQRKSHEQSQTDHIECHDAS